MTPAIRSFIFNSVLYLSGILYGTLCLAFWLLPTRWRFRAVLAWVKFAMWWLNIACGIRIRITDHNGRSPDTPYVILAKHQSMWETFYLQHYFLPASTIFKRSLLFLPFFGWGLSLLHPIAIDRKSKMQSLRRVKRLGEKRLRDGYNLLVFPEGSRIPVGEVGNYARSGAEIAKAAGVPVVPVAHNSGECWPKKHFTKHPGDIYLVIGEPINTTDKDSKEVTRQVKEWIEGQIATMPPGRRSHQKAATDQP